MSAALHVMTVSGTIAAGATVYLPAGSGTGGTPNATEVNVQFTAQKAGTFSNLWCNCTAFSLGGGSTKAVVRFRKNTANGNQVLNVTSATTFRDSSNSDTINAGDVINLSVVVEAGTGSVTIPQMAFLFTDASGNTTTYHVSCKGAGTNYNANSTDYFPSLSGGPTVGTTESNEQLTVKTAGTVANLSVRATANARNTATSVKIRNGGVDKNNTLTFGVGVTGEQQDTSHTDAFAVDELLAIVVRTGATDGSSITFTLITFTYTTTNNTSLLIASGGPISPTQGVTRYLTPSGALAGNITTESLVATPALTTLTVSKLIVHLTANTVLADTVFTSRKNSGAGAQSVTFGTLATGWQVDGSNSDSLTATDTIDVRVVVGAGGTSISMYLMALVLTYPAAAGSPDDVALTRGLSRGLARGLVSAA